MKGGTKNFSCIECFSRHVDAPAGEWEVMICGKRIFRTEDFDLACFVREEAELSKYGFSKE